MSAAQRPAGYEEGVWKVSPSRGAACQQEAHIDSRIEGGDAVRRLSGVEDVDPDGQAKLARFEV